MTIRRCYAEMERRLSLRYGEVTVKRVIAILKDERLWGVSTPVQTRAAARDRLGSIVREARRGSAQLIKRGNAEPMVIVAIEELARLMCRASKPATIGDMLESLPTMPESMKSVWPPHHGGPLRISEICPFESNESDVEG